MMRVHEKIFDKFLLLLPGIVLAAERRNTNKLLDEVFHSEKIYKLNEDMVRICYFDMPVFSSSHNESSFGNSKAPWVSMASGC
jgi:hypothetical protein